MDLSFLILPYLRVESINGKNLELGVRIGRLNLRIIPLAHFVFIGKKKTRVSKFPSGVTWEA